MCISCAITGYGNFTRACIIPALRNSGCFRIKYVLVRSEKRASELNSGNHHNDIIFVSSYNDILNDPDLNCIFIVSRHDKHKEQILRAVRAGKKRIYRKADGNDPA